MRLFTRGRTFKNPIIPKGQDPFVVHYEGLYILVQSEAGKSISFRTAKTLTGLSKASKLIIWTPPPDGDGCRNVWSPELFLLDGKWYIYYAADDGNNINHRIYILESHNNNPMGPYHEKGKIVDPSNKWAIDGTILQSGTKRYIIWSGWRNENNIQQNLYIATLSNPWTINSDRVLLSEPTLSWEIPKDGPSINGSPVILQHNERLFLVYSGNGSWTDDCCMGMLTFTGGDVTNPHCWSKSQKPVFAKNPAFGVYGPGINAFVDSPDSKEKWMVFHANTVSGSGWDGRGIWIQKLKWHADSSPDFGTPISPNTPIPVPSGE